MLQWHSGAETLRERTWVLTDCNWSLSSRACLASSHIFKTYYFSNVWPDWVITFQTCLPFLPWFFFVGRHQCPKQKQKANKRFRQLEPQRFYSIASVLNQRYSWKKNTLPQIRWGFSPAQESRETNIWHKLNLSALVQHAVFMWPSWFWPSHLGVMGSQLCSVWNKRVCFWGFQCD